MAVTMLRPRMIRVLDADPSLAEGLEEAELALALPSAVARVEILEPGAWHPEHDSTARHDHLGLLVLRGLLTRTLTVGGRDFTELLGDGDLLRPWQVAESWSSVPRQRRWDVLERCELAVLDARFALSVARWPTIQAAIVGRAINRARSLAFHLAVSHIRRVEDRLLVMLWHFADRWGRVSPQGVILSVRLTHETLGRVIGARRPTVTSALARLIESGRISRQPDRHLVLHGNPPQDVALTSTRVAV